MKIKEIRQFPHCDWNCDFGWTQFEEFFFKSKSNQYPIDEDPEYQRGYVWSDEQKTKYIEYCLRGGLSGKQIYFNCPNWGNNQTNSKWHDTLELVDGKQRLNCVRSFLNNQVKAFGLYLNEFEDHNYINRDMKFGFKFCVNNLQSKEEVAYWYLGLNGGTPHTKEDFQRVYDYLAKIQTS